MLFNSFEFLLFFVPVSVIIYFVFGAANTERLEFHKIALVAVSLLFYSWWSFSGLLLLISSTIVNYMIGTVLVDQKYSDLGKKRLLWIGLSFNLAILAFYKYFDFFISNINYFFGADIPFLRIALPLGLSFFVFQKIAFLVDCWKGSVGKRGFLDFSLFVFFFPQLVAGPIVHHREMIEQFEDRRISRLNFPNLAAGIFMLSVGLFKKVVIADTLAIWADAGFASAAPLGFFDAWVAALAYTFQLYFDFSGYSDMAVGVALMFNVRLPFNFNSPYRAHSIQDFWRRWHITLSRFLRDYLFIPLGGNRTTRSRLYVNLMVVFVIGGLWHGASWMFVIWGALHGAGVVLHRVWQNHSPFALPPAFAWGLTFVFVTIAWVFFRAPDMTSASNVLRGMAGLQGFALGPLSTSASLSMIALAFGICLMLPNSRHYLGRFRPSIGFTAMACALLAAGLLFVDRTSTFLYWSF